MIGCRSSCDFFVWIQCMGWPGPYEPQERFRGIAVLPKRRASAWEALLPTPVGASRFVIRATHERGVGVPSSRSLATATREANPLYDGGCLFAPLGLRRPSRSACADRRTETRDGPRQ